MFFDSDFSRHSALRFTNNTPLKVLMEIIVAIDGARVLSATMEDQHLMNRYKQEELMEAQLGAP